MIRNTCSYPRTRCQALVPSPKGHSQRDQKFGPYQMVHLQRHLGPVCWGEGGRWMLWFYYSKRNMGPSSVLLFNFIYFIFGGLFWAQLGAHLHWKRKVWIFDNLDIRPNFVFIVGLPPRRKQADQVAWGRTFRVQAHGHSSPRRLTLILWSATVRWREGPGKDRSPRRRKGVPQEGPKQKLKRHQKMQKARPQRGKVRAHRPQKCPKIGRGEMSQKDIQPKPPHLRRRRRLTRIRQVASPF